MKTKIKFHRNRVTDFHNKEIPKADSIYIDLAVISLGSAPKKDGNYYPQAFLKECKYINKKVLRHIIEGLERYFDDSDEE